MKYARSLAVLLVLGSATTALAQPVPDDGYEGHPALRRLTLGLDVGFGFQNEDGPFNWKDGTGSVSHDGTVWGARVGVDVTSFLGFEARYVGAFIPTEPAVNPNGNVGYVLTGGEGILKITAPLPYIQPYIFGGFGYYDFSLYGSDRARAGSLLISASQAGVPAGVGIDYILNRRVSFAFEGTYRYMINEKFSNVMTNGIDGSDFTTFTVLAKVRI